MKKVYVTPVTDVFESLTENFFCLSTKDAYELGDDTSQWPSSGDIPGTPGTGPSSTGAKENSWDLWGEDDEEEW